jgi:hypothetical protein
LNPPWERGKARQRTIAARDQCGYAAVVKFPNPHEAIDTENYERDRRLAALIRRDPAVIALAKRNLELWEKRWGELVPPWQEWRQLLVMLRPDQVAGFLESRTPKANRLRQSTPFLGVLAEAEGAARPV